MTDIDLEVVDWLASSSGSSIERETLASLKMTIGPDAVPVTEVEDQVAKTVRPYINVSAYAVARWLMVNWWRLRWEPLRPSLSLDWMNSHSLAAIGDGFAWPALLISSDGEFIQFRHEAESKSDVSTIRYLRDVTLDVPALSFERAVDAFLDQVEARLSVRCTEERDFGELRRELTQERQESEVAATCKIQALGGWDPGAAPDEWIRTVEDLTVTAGRTATEEIVAITPQIPDGLGGVTAIIEAMRASAAEINLDWIGASDSTSTPAMLPWERGAREAKELRSRIGSGDGPLTDKLLGELVRATLPLKKTWRGNRALGGAYTNGVTKVLVTSDWITSQRFSLARIIGAALASPAGEHVLAVSDGSTAFQKFQRSFAQEFLCPWSALDEYTDEHGTDAEGIADAAEHFRVSELVVRSTLVNKGKVPRHQLQL